MSEVLAKISPDAQARIDRTTAAINLDIRDALLEHARMGRSVVGSRDGVIYETSPAEIFARSGFDEFGRPLPQ